jgi:DNA-binding NarL/FixJ family response regulator
MARQKIELAAEEAEELSRRARATTVSVRDRRRAEIIVLSAQGLTQQRIAEQLGISRNDARLNFNICTAGNHAN